MNINDVFGISREIKPASYVDRAKLDKQFGRLLRRNMHIAVKGPSKSGKSWLRQKAIENANVVQCRFKTTLEDIYVTALGNLGISIISSVEEGNTTSGYFKAEGEAGSKLLAKIAGNAGIEYEHSTIKTKSSTWFRLDNLHFIADTIINSGRRLVIEDFHYLDLMQRQRLAFDLKTLWDYGCFVIVVGIWSQSNLLTTLNPDLSGRIEEISVLWNESDLQCVINQGCQHLNIQIDKCIMDDLIKDSYGNIGILQTLLLGFVEDQCEIEETLNHKQLLCNPDLYQAAAHHYANQLNSIYQQLAKTLSRGIRKRQKSTGIYAITLQVIVDSDDACLLNGLSRDDIYDKAHSMESRIQKGNLKTVLRKIEELQIDDSNRNLVLAYDESSDSVFAVDRQLLFYRKYLTVKWPWEEMIEEALQLSLFDTVSEMNETE